MGTGGGAQHIVGVLVVGCPVAHGFVTGILEGGGAGGDAHHFGPHQAHTKHIGLLALHVHCTHIDTAGQPEQGAGQCCGHTVLSGAGLGDDACLAHALGQQRLSQYLVGLVGTAVQQILALEIEPGLGATGQVATECQRRRATGILGQQGAKFAVEFRVSLGFDKGFFQLQQGWNQNLRNIHAAEFTKKRV